MPLGGTGGVGQRGPGGQGGWGPGGQGARAVGGQGGWGGWGMVFGDCGNRLTDFCGTLAEELWSVVSRFKGQLRVFHTW